jgi:hypothetical protein
MRRVVNAKRCLDPGHRLGGEWCPDFRRTVSLVGLAKDGESRVENRTTARHVHA